MNIYEDRFIIEDCLQKQPYCKYNTSETDSLKFLNSFTYERLSFTIFSEEKTIQVSPQNN